MNILIFPTHNIHAGDITRKEYTNISHGTVMHILFHEQAVCGRGRKWLYYSLAKSVNISIGQRLVMKRGREWISRTILSLH